MEWFLCFLVLLAYFVYLGQTGFARMNDESLYARIAMEMHHRADWTVPTWFGQEAYYKPPFLYWLMFPFFDLLGDNLLAARFPSAIAAIVTLWMTYLIVKRATNRESAFLTAMILATTLNFARYARTAMMEPLMMLSFTANLYALSRAHRGERVWLFAWWVTLGAAGLVKGPVSSLILILTAIFFSVLTRSWKWMLRKESIPGIFAAVVLIFLWPAMIALRGEWHSWWSAFILRENFGKFHDMFYYSPNNLWKRFLVHLVPWSFFLLAAFWCAIQKGRWKMDGVLLQLCFLISFFSVFALPSARLYHYTVAALPSGAMLLGIVYSHFSRERVFRWAAIFTGLLSVLVGLFLAACAFVLNLKNANAYLFLTGIFILGFGIVLFSRKNLAFACGAMTLAYLSSSMVAGHWPYQIFPQECKLTADATPLCVARQSSYLWSYEADRLVPSVDNAADMATCLKTGREVLIAESVLDDFPKDALPPVRILCRWPALRSNFSFHDFVKGVRSGNKLMLEQKIFLVKAR